MCLCLFWVIGFLCFFFNILLCLIITCREILSWKTQAATVVEVHNLRHNQTTTLCTPLTTTRQPHYAHPSPQPDNHIMHTPHHNQTTTSCTTLTTTRQPHDCISICTGQLHTLCVSIDLSVYIYVDTFLSARCASGWWSIQSGRQGTLASWTSAVPGKQTSSSSRGTSTATPKSGKPPAGWPSTPCWRWSGEAWTPGRDTSELSEVCFADRHALCLCPTLSVCLSVCLSHFCFADRHALCLCLSVCLTFSCCLCFSVCLTFSCCLCFSLSLTVCLSFCLCVSHFLLLALSFCLSVSLSLTDCVSHFLLLCLSVSLSLCAVFVSLSASVSPISLLLLFLSFCFFRLTLCCPRGNSVHSPVTVSGSVMVCIHLWLFQVP